MTLYEAFLDSSGVCTDTRRISKDCLFVALKGDKFNANTFAQQALDLGAKYALIDDPTCLSSDRMFLVEDGLSALQGLAHTHRQTLHIPIVALTGSNGKTTSKELMSRVLSSNFKLWATEGNLNNHIGVPLTLLQIKADHQMAIIEMGANHQGEIAQLCQIAQPTHGLINNIGKAHLEGFGGEEGIKKGKGELFDYLEKSGGKAFVRQTDAVLSQMAADRPDLQVIWYGQEPHEPFYELLSENPEVQFLVDGEAVKTHLPGAYNYQNMLGAMAVGLYFGVSEANCIQAVSSYQPTNNRSQWIQKNTNKIILDAYNANPSSMAEAIRFFGQLDAPHKIVILGNMLELGDQAASEHWQIGKLIAEQNFDLVILYGPLMEAALPALPRALFFTDKFSLHNYLKDSKIQDATLLIKGSRGVALESVLEVL